VPGERETPARGRGVENIPGPMHCAVGSATDDNFAQHFANVTSHPAKFTTTR